MYSVCACALLVQCLWCITLAIYYALYFWCANHLLPLTQLLV